jgi:hypothetical protein
MLHDIIIAICGGILLLVSLILELFKGKWRYLLILVATIFYIVSLFFQFQRDADKELHAEKKINAQTETIVTNEGLNHAEDKENYDTLKSLILNKGYFYDSIKKILIEKKTKNPMETPKIFICGPPIMPAVNSTPTGMDLTFSFCNNGGLPVPQNSLIGIFSLVKQKNGTYHSAGGSFFRKDQPIISSSTPYPVSLNFSDGDNARFEDTSFYMPIVVYIDQISNKKIAAGDYFYMPSLKKGIVVRAQGKMRRYTRNLLLAKLKESTYFKDAIFPK